MDELFSEMRFGGANDTGRRMSWFFRGGGGANKKGAMDKMWDVRPIVK